VSAGRRAVFLDRDGVLNERPPAHEYLTSTADFRWLPDAREGVAELARRGYAAVVVSNQRGVARGLVTEATLREIEKVIQAGLEPYGAAIEAFYYCPHGLDEDCPCRKPRPGLLLRAADELGLDLAASVMIGDAPSDVLAGAAAGCRTVLVAPSLESGSRPDLVVADLPEAARLL
jgi:D-glycero-D-manno-heptose 1,7-bisphosphate phosphatase